MRATVIMGWIADVSPRFQGADGRRPLHEPTVFARFRYDDLKAATRGCGGREPHANSMV